MWSLFMNWKHNYDLKSGANVTFARSTNRLECMFCHSWAFLILQQLQSWLKDAAIWTRFVQGMLHLLYGAFVCFACVAHAAVGILPATVQQVGAAGVDLRQPEPPLFGRARASQVETHKQNESKTLSSEAPRQWLYVFTGLCDLFIYVNDPLVMSWNKLDQTSWNGIQCRTELVTPKHLNGSV